MTNQIICMMGPTASGKSQLAMKLSAQYPFEIISVDSVQVYRGLDIGSAKPSLEDRKTIPHHLIDIRDPWEFYSCGDFYEDVQQKIKAIHGRDKIPLLVGGTMLYFHVFYNGIDTLPRGDLEIRKKLNDRLTKEGVNVLHEELKEIDPEAAERIHPNDPQRIQRALEVYALTEQPITSHYKAAESLSKKYNTLTLIIAPEERAVIHERIAMRFQKMLEDRFVEEVRALKSNSKLHADLPSMRSVGYRQVWNYLEGQCDHDQMVELGIIATRQFAKRQFTWIRRWEGMDWRDYEDPEIEKQVDEFICQSI